MPYEHDDLGLRIIGYNQPISFYDSTRTLRAQIYLQPDNTLNVGGLTAGGSGSTSAGGTHGLGDLAIHTGTLNDAQAPQFLKADGTRPLTGNLTVNAGVTIDGVDLSGFKGAYDNHVVNVSAHHDPVTIGTGGLSAKLGLATQVLTLASIEHHELAGLADDDHPQYAALAQNESITGAWRFTNNLTTRHILPANTDTYDLGSSTLLWRKGWLSELDTVIFAENTITLLGGWFYITKYAGTVNQSITLVDTQIDLGVDNNVLSTGDHIAFRQSGKVEYMTLGSYNSVSHKWNVTRNVDGSGIDTWPDGAPFVALGKSGDGRIELNAYDTPRISIVKQGAKYNEQTELIRLGDLNGLADYTAENYGLFVGDFAGNKWLAYDQTNSLRIRGDALIQGTVDATKFTVGMSDQLFSNADGRLLLGPNDALTATSWTSRRGQVAAMSGGFYQVQGPWPGSRAMIFEPETTNLHTNPSFEVSADQWTVNGCTIVRSTAGAVFGTACGLATKTIAEVWRYAGRNHPLTGATAGRTFTFSVYVKAATNADVGNTARIEVHELGGASASAGAGVSFTLTNTWQRVAFTRTIVQNDRTYLSCRVLPNYAAASGAVLIDGAQIEELPYATSYCDGSLGAGYTWTGIAHDTASTRAVKIVSFAPQSIIDLAAGSMSFWFQMPYDAGTTGLNAGRGLFVWWDAYNTQSLYLAFATDFSCISAISFAGGVANSTPQAMLTGSKAGDWHHLVLTYDAAGAGYRKFYLDGVLVSHVTTYTAPTIASTTAYLGAASVHFGGAIAEFAVFGRPLTAAEVAAQYHRNAPLVDTGAIDAPGLYILDGKFRVASSTSGTRIEITPEMIAGYSDATTKQFYLQASDGKAYAGGGAVMLDEDGILITTADLQENVIQFENSDVTLAAGVTGLLNLQSVDPNSNAYGAFNYGWATNDGKNRSLVSCWQYEIDFLIQKAGDYRYVLEANYDYIRTNAPLIVVAQSAEPSTGVANGMLYYDTDTNKLMVRANGSWVALH